MIQVGIHNAYASRDWKVDYADVISRVSTIGFDILESNPGTFLEMPPHARHDLKNLAADKGIKLIFSFGLPPHYDVSSPDEMTRSSGIRYCQDIIKVVAEMGGDMLGGCIYSYWPYQYQGVRPEREKLTANAIRSVRECVKTAEDYGIDYALEPLNRFEQVILNTAREGVDFCRQVDSPRIKLLLDTFHMNIEEDSFEDAIRTAAGYFVDVHMDENNRKFPGTGAMPWEKIFSTFKQTGYDKYVVLEPFMITGGEVGNCVYLWRDLTNRASQEQMDAMAKESLAYIRSLIAGQ
jgi:D-psicose/D-tagatose/L-ribulose 3-epimerase